MSGFFGGGAHKDSVDPDRERLPPPQPTFVYFPQNDISIQGTDKWLQNTPHLDVHYSRVSKPADIHLAHVAALNTTVHSEEPLEAFVPGGNLPPPSWLSAAQNLNRKGPVGFENGYDKTARLSNGHKVPDPETFVKYAKELVCNTDDALRMHAGLKLKSGRAPPHIKAFAEFWHHLGRMAQYWDSSLDHYYDIDTSRPTTPSPGKAIKRTSFFGLTAKHATTAQPTPPPKDDKGKRYKGRRISNGVRMPDDIRGDVVRSFVRVIVNLFECQFAYCRITPQLEIKKLLIPVSQSGIAWRLPNSAEQNSRMGMVEGPVLGVQCRNETNFLRDPQAAIIDVARETAGLLLQAQQRAREGKTRKVPGRGQWYTTRPRWGGGPGGPFGEYEGKTERPIKRHTVPGQNMSPMKTEEEVWRELRPNDSQWAPRTAYLAVGKDRKHAEDVVFMVSSVFHHISFLKMRVHPAYVEWTLTGKKPPPDHPDDTWYKPQVYRTRWFDLLKSEDRGEAMRALWGVMAYQMRGERHERPGMPRQNSEMAHRLHMGRKKLPETDPAALTTIRSHSVA